MISDNYLIYDKFKKRYILTPKCVLDELGINLEVRLNVKKSSTPQATVNAFLDRVSYLIYNYIFKHNDKQTLQYILDNVISTREIIKEAMKCQLLYILSVGDLTMSTDINKRKFWLDDSAYAILLRELPETGKSLLYTGRY